jgi:hypothetical protein
MQIWVLVLTLFTTTNDMVAYGPIKIASAPTQQMCEHLKHSIKKHPINIHYSCVRVQ